MGNRSVQLTFLGGAGTVTGSKTLVRTGNKQWMVDCGLFQGLKQLRLLNWEGGRLDPTSIDRVILTHGHLDHIGYLPRLVADGFRGRVHCTEPTRDLARIILTDSASIQEQDARRANREGYSKHQPAEPLYTKKDVKKTLSRFETHPAGEWIEPGTGPTFCFRKNGHILGSAMVAVDTGGRRVVFSGDLGRPDQVLLRAPEPLPPCDALVLESTYGDRLHANESPREIIKNVVNHTCDKSGTLVIPSFAVGRAQVVLHTLNELKKAGDIPDVPIFLDSPMGIDVTELMLRYRSWHRLDEGQCRALLENVEPVERVQETKDVLARGGTRVVIAGSGMLTGGRVLYYLEDLLGEPSTSILLTGFQAQGTRGRLLRDGAPELKFFGRYHPVRAEVFEAPGLSVHADQSEITDWLMTGESRPRQVFLNHGEPQAAQTLRVKLQDLDDWEVRVAEQDRDYHVSFGNDTR